MPPNFRNHRRRVLEEERDVCDVIGRIERSGVEKEEISDPDS